MKREGKRRGGKREADAVSESWGGMLRGVAIGVLAAVFLLGVCAVLIAIAAIPEGYMNGCVLLVCAIGALAGGCMALRGKWRRTVLWGLCVGLLTAIVLGVAGFLLYGGLEPQRCAAVGAACLCGGGLAGVLGKSRGKKRRT